MTDILSVIIFLDEALNAALHTLMGLKEFDSGKNTFVDYVFYSISKNESGNNWSAHRKSDAESQSTVSQPVCIDDSTCQSVFSEKCRDFRLAICTQRWFFGSSGSQFVNVGYSLFRFCKIIEKKRNLKWILCIKTFPYLNSKFVPNL